MTTLNDGTGVLRKAPVRKSKPSKAEDVDDRPEVRDRREGSKRRTSKRKQ